MSSQETPASRTIWVTGASRGVGRAIAHRLASPRVRMGVTARSPAPLEELATQLRANGSVTVTLPVDVTDSEAMGDAARHLAAGGAIDVVAVNAGVRPVLAPLQELDDAQWRRVLDVNLGGALVTVRAAIPHLARDAVVVLVGSVHATRGQAGLAPYAASKAGVEALTRSLSLELAPRRIRVVAVAPGYVETDMTAALRASDHHQRRLLDRIPLGRFAQPDEVASVVAFLASQDASYLTGTVVHGDGGWSAA